MRKKDDWVFQTRNDRGTSPPGLLPPLAVNPPEAGKSKPPAGRVVVDSNRSAELRWPQLIPGTLIRRYQRFLADVRLQNGQTVIAHCPNTGSMKGCSEPGRPVYVSFHGNPQRKLKYTWELIDMPTSLVGVNTFVSNRLVYAAVKAGRIPELCGYRSVAREVNVSDHSRIDLMLADGIHKHCYVEIKNCTLVDNRVARFPDAVTTRGLKHIQELQALVNSKCRCVMFYFIQRMDARLFKPADDIDPDYGAGLRKAVKRGIEIIAYDVRIDLNRIRLNRRIPCEL